MNEQLVNFVDECKRIDSRLELYTSEYGHVSIRIQGKEGICLAGYNFPYQAHLITNYMKDNGCFR